MADIINMIFLLILTICSVGATLFQFENNRISNWKLQLGANEEENAINFCRYNATRNENICYNKDELISKCGCTFSNYTESESFTVNCCSSLADCPEHLSFSFQQGSFRKRPEALEIILFFSLLLNYCLIFVLVNYRARVNSYFKENWQQYVNNGASINVQLRSAGY